MIWVFAFSAIASLTWAQNLLYEPMSNVPKPCCSPDKVFEVTMKYLGATMKAGNGDAITETHRTSIDITGQRVSVQIFNEDVHEMSVHYIYLYKKKMYYLIVPNAECLIYQLNGTLTPPCVPDSATFVGSNQLDPENHTLEVNHWLDNSKGYPMQYTTSVKHCFPISESYYYSLRGPQGESKILKISYSDYRRGLADPSVLVPPSTGCIPGNGSPVRYSTLEGLYNPLNLD